MLAGRPIQEREAERKLFFWTAEQLLILVRRLVLLIALVAVVVWFVSGLTHGHFDGIGPLL